MRLVHVLFVLCLAALLSGCHSNSYNYHYGGHGHYGPGHEESHHGRHYGSFGYR